MQARSMDDSEIDSWVDASDIIHEGIDKQYFVSFYWAVLTLFTTGYGDIVPHNDGERAMAAFTILIGSIIFAYLIGQVNCPHPL